MATVHFTGTIYRGSDGSESLTLTTPGPYQVSDAKAAQLTQDFPAELALVLEGKAADAPSSDPETKKVDAPAKDTKSASSPAKKDALPMATVHEILSNVANTTPLPVATAPLASAIDTVTVVQDSNSTAALTQVSSLTSSQVILPANTARKEAVIYNNSTANLYLAFTGTASLTAFTVKLATNTAYVLPMPLYKGVISGIWDAANGSDQVTEY
jgi:hypothetical protein